MERVKVIKHSFIICLRKEEQFLSICVIVHGEVAAKPSLSCLMKQRRLLQDSIFPLELFHLDIALRVHHPSRRHPLLSRTDPYPHIRVHMSKPSPAAPHNRHFLQISSLPRGLRPSGLIGTAPCRIWRVSSLGAGACRQEAVWKPGRGLLSASPAESQEQHALPTPALGLAGSRTAARGGPLGRQPTSLCAGGPSTHVCTHTYHTLAEFNPSIHLCMWRGGREREQEVLKHRRQGVPREAGRLVSVPATWLSLARTQVGKRCW